MFNSTNGILAVMKGTATRPRLGQRVFWFVCAVVCLLACSAAVSASERVTYLHTDNLGSVIAGTDEAGNLLWREQYEPYGLKRLLPANAEGQRLWYTGHAHDDAMALSYFGARWYDPDAGRFLAVDPVDWVEERPMHSFNRYAYANNNPYKFVDPDGQIAVPVFVVGIWFISDVVLPAFQDAPNGSVQSAGTPLDLGAAAGLLRSAGKIVSGVSRSDPQRGLGNPFKNSNLSQIEKAFDKKVKEGKLELKYSNPKTGAKSYKNTKSGYSYNLDPGGKYGRKLEGPHVDVNYPNPKPTNRPPKKKLPVSGGFQ